MPAKIPPDIFLRSEIQLLIWKPRGVLNEKVVNQIIAFLREEEASEDSHRLRFTDTSELTAVDLNFRYVFHIGLHRRMTRAARAPIKSAFYVEDPGFEHYFKLHKLLTDHSALEVKIFESRDDAAKWLETPVAALDAP
jgi:hypothetical protein